MNKKVKKIWLVALKSGKYTQAKGRLRRRTWMGEDSFCCLGVLCDLSITHLNTSSRWADTRGQLGSEGTLASRVFKFNDEGSGVVGRLPGEVRKWAGLTIDNAHGLSTINDRAGTPENENFAEVIESIESTL